MMKFLSAIILIFLLSASAFATDYVDSFSSVTTQWVDGHMRSVAAGTSYYYDSLIILVSLGTQASYTRLNTGYFAWEGVATSLPAGRIIDSARLYAWPKYATPTLTWYLRRSMQYMTGSGTTWTNANADPCPWSTPGGLDQTGDCVENNCDVGPDVAPTTGCGVAYTYIANPETGEYLSHLITDEVQRHQAYTSTELGNLMWITNPEQVGEYDTLILYSEESIHPPFIKIWSHTAVAGNNNTRRLANPRRDE